MTLGLVKARRMRKDSQAEKVKWENTVARLRGASALSSVGAWGSMWDIQAGLGEENGRMAHV